MRIPRRARRVPDVGRGPVSPVDQQRDRLTSLLDVVTRAIELQPEAEEVISACARTGDTPVWVARQGGRIAFAYCRLHGRAAELAATAAPDSVPARATQLISYHAAMVDLCLKLAFPNILSTRLDNRRRMLDGLGEPAAVLRDLRVVLEMCVHELDA